MSQCKGLASTGLEVGSQEQRRARAGQPEKKQGSGDSIPTTAKENGA